MPERVQLSRRKGWRMPENTVSVARPTKWGNPFPVDDGCTVEQAIAHFRRGLRGASARGMLWTAWAQRILDDLPELRGKNLACWCPLDQPCHADVLLELANADPAGEASPQGRPAAAPTGAKPSGAEAPRPASEGDSK